MTVALTASLASADEPSSGTVEVVAVGTGTDETSAVKRAIESAVRQAVGMVVDVETVVSNDEVIKERVLSASNAIVTKYEPVGRPEREGDLITVQIRATVQRGEVQRRLEEAKVVSVKVDGAAAFAKAASALKNDADAVEVVRAAFDGFPGNVLKVTPVGEPEVVGREGELNLVALKIRHEIDLERYAAWRKTYAPLFARIAQGTIEWRYDPHESTRWGAQDFRALTAAERRSTYPYIPNDAWATTYWSEGIFEKGLMDTGVFAVAERPGSSKVIGYKLPVLPLQAIATASVVAPTIEVILLDKDRNEISGKKLVGGYSFNTNDGKMVGCAATLFAQEGREIFVNNLESVKDTRMSVTPSLRTGLLRCPAFEVPFLFRLSDADLAKVTTANVTVDGQSSGRE